MTPRESNLADCLLEDALDEVFHGGPDSALADRIIKVARREADTDSEFASQADLAAGQPHVALSDAPAPRPLLTTARPRRWWRYAAEAAVAACVIALVAVLIVPRKPIEPPGVIAFSGAEYEYAHQAEIPEVAVQSGWYVLQDGAPELRSGSNRVQDVKGQVIVKVGEVPNQAELAAMGPWLSEHQIEVEEIEMLNGTWIKAGTLAVFLVTGSAFVDGNFLQAQDREVRKKETERREAEKKAEGEKREVERKKEPERPAAELERLRDELAELEKRAEEARELENERERKARLERIEKAMKQKRERIAELEGKVAEREKVRDGEREKEPKVERRKEAEGDNAEKRREADRRKKAEEEERRRADEEAKEAEARKRREKELDEAERRREADKREAERKREPERKERKQ